MRERRSNAVLASRTAAAGAAVAILVGACSGNDPAPSPTTTPSAAARRATPTVGASPSVPTSTDVAQVEAVYRRYWTVGRYFDQQYRQADWRRVLSSVAADPLLSLVLAQAATQKRSGIKLYGQVVVHPTVVKQSGEQMLVKDCQDASHAGQADASTGKPRTVGVARNPVTATVRRGSDGHWRLTALTFPGGAC